MTVLLEVKRIEPNKWNPNVMDSEENNALLEDMRAHGPRSIDDILVSPKQRFYENLSLPVDHYVIIDGEHRWKNAVKLEWSTIRADIQHITEAEAKKINYRKNKERGRIDPYREGQLFILENQLGLTQEQIAAKYGVNQSFVSRRMKIAGFQPEVIKVVEQYKLGLKEEAGYIRKDYEGEEDQIPRFRKEHLDRLEERVENLSGNMPHGITSSHLEEIVTLKTQEKRAEAIKDVLVNERSVFDTKDKVGRLKQVEEKEEKLRQAIKNSEFKVCPQCGSPPMKIHYNGLPHIVCNTSGYAYDAHTWNLKTGLTATQEEKQKQEKYLKDHPEEAEKKEAEHKEKFKPKSFRYPETVPELRAKLSKRVFKLISTLDRFENVRITGYDKEGQEVDIDLGRDYDTIMSYSETVREKSEETKWAKKVVQSTIFRVEHKEWKTDKVNKVKN